MHRSPSTLVVAASHKFQPHFTFACSLDLPPPPPPPHSRILNLSPPVALHLKATENVVRNDGSSMGQKNKILSHREWKYLTLSVHNVTLEPVWFLGVVSNNIVFYLNTWEGSRRQRRRQEKNCIIFQATAHVFIFLLLYFCFSPYYFVYEHPF